MAPGLAMLGGPETSGCAPTHSESSINARQRGTATLRWCALDAAADQELKNHGRVAVPDAVSVSKNRWLIRCQHGADVPTSAHREGHHWWSAQL